jgi:hypothetical protein
VQAENEREITVSLICVDAPTEDSDNTVNKQFFEELQENTRSHPKT